MKKKASLCPGITHKASTASLRCPDTRDFPEVSAPGRSPQSQAEVPSPGLMYQLPPCHSAGTQIVTRQDLSPQAQGGLPWASIPHPPDGHQGYMTDYLTGNSGPDLAALVSALFFGFYKILSLLVVFYRCKGFLACMSRHVPYACLVSIEVRRGHWISWN